MKKFQILFSIIKSGLVSENFFFTVIRGRLSLFTIRKVQLFYWACQLSLHTCYIQARYKLSYHYQKSWLAGWNSCYIMNVMTPEHTNTGICGPDQPRRLAASYIYVPHVPRGTYVRSMSKLRHENIGILSDLPFNTHNIYFIYFLFWLQLKLRHCQNARLCVIASYQRWWQTFFPKQICPKVEHTLQQCKSLSLSPVTFYCDLYTNIACCNVHTYSWVNSHYNRRTKKARHEIEPSKEAIWSQALNVMSLWHECILQQQQQQQTERRTRSWRFGRSSLTGWARSVRSHHPVS